eukprot:4367657-Pleurochrysis_carterae.AAC.1
MLRVVDSDSWSKASVFCCTTISKRSAARLHGPMTAEGAASATDALSRAACTVSASTRPVALTLSAHTRSARSVRVDTASAA